MAGCPRVVEVCHLTSQCREFFWVKVIPFPSWPKKLPHPWPLEWPSPGRIAAPLDGCGDQGVCLVASMLLLDSICHRLCSSKGRGLASLPGYSAPWCSMWSRHGTTRTRDDGGTLGHLRACHEESS